MRGGEIIGKRVGGEEKKEKEERRREKNINNQSHNVNQSVISAVWALLAYLLDQVVNILFPFPDLDENQRTSRYKNTRTGFQGLLYALPDYFIALGLLHSSS